MVGQDTGVGILLSQLLNRLDRSTCGKQADVTGYQCRREADDEMVAIRAQIDGVPLPWKPRSQVVYCVEEFIYRIRTSVTPRQMALCARMRKEWIHQRPGMRTGICLPSCGCRGE